MPANFLCFSACLALAFFIGKLPGLLPARRPVPVRAKQPTAPGGRVHSPREPITVRQR
jgi:hypothetical protein